MLQNKTISGYVTTKDCVTQKYPWKECIKSMFGFCDEVIVVDGGSLDGTWQELQNLAKENDKLKIYSISRDWSHPRHAVFDGAQKAEARKLCTKDFCWQMDADEIVHENDYEKIKNLANHWPNKEIQIISLPVIEYWGGPEKVRLDIQPWKWRISVNDPVITHGIPIELRRFDSNGDLYAAEGTDGCDMIHSETGNRIDHATFHTQQTEMLRQIAQSGNAEAISAYEAWFNKVIENLPGVYHYSWYDISRKIRLYKGYWTKHWNSLYNKSLEDNAESNMMFDLSWSSVTDEMIEKRALELKEKTGGWIWHRKWNGQSIPHIKVYSKEPMITLSAK